MIEKWADDLSVGGLNFLELFAEAIRPDGTYSEYRFRPVEMIETEFGVRLADDMKTVAESVRDNPVTVVISANSTGKTHLGAHLCGWFYKAQVDAEVYTTAAPPEDNLTNILWKEIGYMYRNNPAIFGSDRYTKLRIQGSHGHIVGLTIPASADEKQREARFSGKHAPSLLFLVDEADAVPDEIFDGIESCMTGGFARLVCFFNPRRRSGRVYDMIRKGEANVVRVSALSHPNVVTGRDQIPGAVDRNTTVRRILEWSRALDSDDDFDEESDFLIPDYLAGVRAKLRDGTLSKPLPATPRRVTDEALYYMVLAKYAPEGAYQLIRERWINQAEERWMQYVARYGGPPEGIAPIAGLDVAEAGTDWNFLTLRYGDFVAKPKKWKGDEPNATGRRAANLVYDSGGTHCLIDGIGIGSGCVSPFMETFEMRVRASQGSLSPMRRGSINCATKVIVSRAATKRAERGLFNLLRDQLYWDVREWLRDDENHRSSAMLYPNDELRQELLALNYAYTKSGKIVVGPEKKDLRTMLKRSIDRAESLMLTFAPQRRVTHSHVRVASVS